MACQLGCWLFCPHCFWPESFSPMSLEGEKKKASWPAQEVETRPSVCKHGSRVRFDSMSVPVCLGVLICGLYGTVV